MLTTMLVLNTVLLGTTSHTVYTSHSSVLHRAAIQLRRLHVAGRKLVVPHAGIYCALPRSVRTLLVIFCMISV